ncbi:hypothetical protein FDZ71_00550 [bacterium]|nr:MAG: hypothetical protein FDZ71_00550 [bacterium]
MSKLFTALKVLGLLFFDYFALGVLGQQLALLASHALSRNSAGAWLVYASGLLMAAVSALIGVRLGSRVRGASLLVRTTLFSFPLFFCTQFLIAGVTDWNPLPLLLGYIACLACAVVGSVASGSKRIGLVSPPREQAFPADGAPQ